MRRFFNQKAVTTTNGAGKAFAGFVKSNVNAMRFFNERANEEAWWEAAIKRTEKIFLGCVKAGLNANRNEPFFHFQSWDSAFAYKKISDTVIAVEARTKTVKDLRDVIALHEPKMGKSLKLSLGAYGATSSSYDANMGLQRSMSRYALKQIDMRSQTRSK